MSSEAIKLEISFSEEVADTLLKLAKEKGVGVNTLIQRAIIAEKFITDVQNKKGKFIVEYGPNDFKEISFK